MCSWLRDSKFLILTFIGSANLALILYNTWTCQRPRTMDQSTSKDKKTITDKRQEHLQTNLFGNVAASPDHESGVSKALETVLYRQMLQDRKLDYIISKIDVLLGSRSTGQKNLNFPDKPPNYPGNLYPNFKQE